ncbi:tRNA-intron endonuclease catalytic domain-like protein, partial [Suhomyces tanzawaensis NRRL Y-17324]
PVLLPLINSSHPEVLVFNVNDIRTLREHGVLGVLIGTLAQYPQQNFYLSVPLRLQIWEVLWLLDRGLARLVDYVKYRQFLKDTLSQDALSQDALSPQNTPSHDTLSSTNSLSPFEVSSHDYLNRLPVTPAFVSNYLSFKFLKEMGYFISPGLKFGGDLVIYPGDPLKFHSYSIVKFGHINVNDLVVGGRLATGVKKNYVIMDDMEQPEATESEIFSEPKKLAFSVEWAGFG